MWAAFLLHFTFSHLLLLYTEKFSAFLQLTSNFESPTQCVLGFSLLEVSFCSLNIAECIIFLVVVSELRLPGSSWVLAYWLFWYNKRHSVLWIALWSVELCLTDCQLLFADRYWGLENTTASLSIGTLKNMPKVISWCKDKNSTWLLVLSRSTCFLAVCWLFSPFPL